MNARLKNEELPTLQEFALRVELAIREKNSLPIRTRGGKSGRELWAADTRELKVLPADQIAVALLRRKQGKIGRQGIEHNKVSYMNPRMFNHVGRMVEYGWLESRPECIHVFLPAAQAGRPPEYLGLARPIDPTSYGYSALVDQARQRRIETCGEIDRLAREMRAENLQALRSAVGGESAPEEGPGTPPERQTSRRPRAVDLDMARRLAAAKESGNIDV